MIKLTIIIPTFNRCNQVKENLDNILPQILNNKESVNIYISDNASTDRTKEIVEPFVRKHPETVSYFCHSENITATPNFNHAVHSVNSEYVYILGDDDLLFPNFIETALNLINENPNVGLFHFNYLLGERNLALCKVAFPNLQSGQIIYYENGGDFIKKHLDGPSFVSSNLFKRQLWLDGVELMKTDCYGYVWFSILLFGCLKYKCAYYSCPMLIQRFPVVCRYSTNLPLYYIVGLSNLFKYLDKSISGVYSSWVIHSQQVYKYNFLIVLGHVCYSKKLYSQHYSEVTEHLHKQSHRLFFAVLLRLPVWFSKWCIINVLRCINAFRKYAMKKQG